MFKASARTMVKISVGMMGSSVASGSSSLSTPAQVSAFLDVVKKHGIKELDTARVYNKGRSEELLGEVSAFKDFDIATKAPAFMPGSLTESNILENCEKSLKALQVEKVDLYYLHGPDSKTPFGEQCRAINTLYKQGKFSRWGVSNLTPDQVQEVYDICEKEGYKPPTVYQGGYNPINRPMSENALLPLLKKLNMMFYAYSPLAGGLLAKPISQIKNPEKGSRFHAMKVFGDMYLTEGNVAALEKLQGVCDAEGVGLMEATMRWFVHHSPLGEEDGVILGASSEAQLEKSLSACEKEKLPELLVKAFEELRENAKVEMPKM
jgi:aflatoxin B1 aldehyde reductase